jgi:hypothetical protein
VLALVRSVAVAFLLALLSAPPIIQRVLGGDTRAYVVTTIIMAVAAAAFAMLPDAQHSPVLRPPAILPRAITLTASVLCAAALIVICRRWLQQIFTTPIDAFVADMLVVIREGLRRASRAQSVRFTVPCRSAAIPSDGAPYAVMLLRADSVSHACRTAVRAGHVRVRRGRRCRKTTLRAGARPSSIDGVDRLQS